MTRALLVSPSFLPGRGGIESFLAQTCEEVAPDLAVVAPATRDRQSLPAGLPYETIPFPGRLLWPGRKPARAIVNAAAAHGVSRVLFGTPWPIALLGPRLRRAGLSYASFVHGAELLVPAAIPGVRHLLASALRQADCLFAVSRFTAEHVQHLIGTPPAAPPVHVVYPSVDTEHFHPDAGGNGTLEKWSLQPEDKIVLHLGRLVPRKGADRLVRLAPLLTASEARARVVIAGTGPELRKLRRKAARTPGVIVTGRVSTAEARSLYARATVFALPVVDRWLGLEVEGLGVVLLEASASGTPCVTGRSGGTPEAVVHGETGFVVDARDERELQTALERLLRDDDLARELGRKAREHVRLHFTGSRRLQPLLDWIHDTPPRETSPPR